MAFRPLSDRLLVRIDPPKKMSGSIILTKEERIRTGEVVALGPGKWAGSERAPMGVSVGDKVAFYHENLIHMNAKAIAVQLAKEGDDLCLLQERDVLFVLPEGESVEISA